MNLHPLTGFVRSIILAGLFLVCQAATAQALTLSFSSRQDLDTLNLSFTQQAEKPEIIRTGAKELTLRFPKGSLAREKLEQNGGFGQSRLVQGLNVEGDNIVLTLSTDAFGFLPSPGTAREIRLQIFRDPQGARWQPPKQAAPQPQAQPAQPDKSDQSAQSQVEPAQPKAQTPEREPYYAVPNVVRSEIKREPQTPAAAGSPAQAQTVPNQASAQAAPPAQTPAPAAASSAVSGQGAVVAEISRPAPAAQAPALQPASQNVQAIAPQAAPAPALPEQSPASQVTGKISLPAKPQEAAQSQPATQAPAQPQAIAQPAAPQQLTAPSAAASGAQFQGQIQMPIKPQAQPIAPAKPEQPAPDSQAKQQIQASPKPEPQVKPQATPQAPAAPQASGQIQAPPAPKPEESQSKPAQASEGKPQAGGEISLPKPTPSPEKPAPKVEPAKEAKAEPKAKPDPKAKTEPAGPSEDELKAQREKQEADDQEMLLSALASQAMGEPQAAREALEALVARPNLRKDVREEALYTLADCLYEVYKPTLRQNIDLVQGAYQAAMNVDPKSKRVPQALAQLGNVNLRVGNYPEAKGYFNVLKQRYPNDESIPLINYNWGEHYYNEGQYAKAAEEFQTLIQKYPESRFVQESSLGLAKSLVKIGNFKQASQIVDYVDKRWPRFYIDDPAFLRLMADLNYRLENFDKAKDNYLTFYNLNPKAENMDMLLLRLGESYAKVGKQNVANDFYKKAVDAYPDQEGGIIAKMRLAEDGVRESDDVNEMFAAFDQPGKEAPDATYAEIVRKFPDSPLGPMAQLKLAMWKLYKKQYQPCLDEVAKFLKLYPKSELAERARDLAYQAFLGLAGQQIQEEKYQRILETLKDLPYIAAKQESFPPEVLLGMAKAYLLNNQTEQGLRLLDRFLPPKQQPPLGEKALNMALDVYLPKQDWRNIVALAERVMSWNLEPATRRRLDFALALALETLGEYAKSRPLWAKIGMDSGLPGSVRAVAVYNLAKAALASGEPDKALSLARDTLSLLGPDGDPEMQRGAVNMAIEVSKFNKRPADAIKWCEFYAKFTKPGEEDWASNQYRLAGFLRYTGNVTAWRSTLADIVAKAPNTLHGKTAAAELNSYKIESAVEKAISPWQ